MQLENLMIAISKETMKKLAKVFSTSVEKVAGSISGTLGKFVKLELTEKIKEQASTEGLYHFVLNDKIADLILESQYIKASNNITSYGRRSTFMFCGAPTVDNYAKNLSDSSALSGNNLWDKQINPYITPTLVSTAIRIKPQMKDLANYKFRGLQDGVISYEGFCVLPSNSSEKVKMVPDLVRDINGNPIKDDRGEYQVAFREAVPEEILNGGKYYNAKPDYLKYMKEKGIEYGYLHKDGSPKSKFMTKIALIGDLSRMEFDENVRNIEKNGRSVVKSFLGKIKTILNRKPELPQSIEETLRDFNFRKKNPYRDKKFSLMIAEIQAKEGLSQLDLHSVLSEFTHSSDGEFFEKKYKQLEDRITRGNKYGKEHSNRVSLVSILIARNEGVLRDDSNNRIKDILSTASYLHDIGQGFTADFHSVRAARKIAKMDLRYVDGKPYSDEDKKIVLALVEAHEGKTNKIDKMVEKHNIREPENIALAKRLNSILRDADALDRARLDWNLLRYKVDLNPKLLVNNTSKQLINSAYQLAFLTKRTNNFYDILQYGKPEETAEQRFNQKSKEFDERIQVGMISLDRSTLNSKSDKQEVLYENGKSVYDDSDELPHDSL